MQIGANSLDLLPETLVSLGCSFPCVITDKTMLELGYVAKVEALLNQQNINFGLFTDTMPEPNDTSILAAVEMVKTKQYDCLIALGGGSAIDSAKAIALLASHGGKMSDYKVPYQVTEISLPVVAIPTTAGTGSEATKVTVISDSATDEKMLCMGSGLIPAAAIIDYQFTLSLPSRIAADTGIDALTHAIEAYVSRKANLFSDQQAIAAMKLIAPNLIKVCQQPDNLKAKEAMMLGATLAGIAFSNASVGLVHGMSRPIGVHFHVPHGLSNAMLLPTITEYSLPGAPRKYAECAMHMGLVTVIDDQTLAHQTLINELKHINQTLNVPTLAEFGVVKTEYEGLLTNMAEQALASGSPGNNPKIPVLNEIIELYKKVWL
ncbi:alcohol dehydrogenase 4 [Paraglaciecola arctica BSs20135]|uniref:Alcohol dehydrogenase 4 n=2 Tax=Paraglaciecola TaxID=1621534 RepID=K6YKA2_9ALTE|nr:alcohol dehydrogenase 4 [Paraglaciecola arctica BSs20135]